jgi:hypothetical protein
VFAGVDVFVGADGCSHDDRALCGDGAVLVHCLVPQRGWTAAQQESAFVDAPCELPDESLEDVDVVQESFRVAVTDEVVCERPGLVP